MLNSQSALGNPQSHKQKVALGLFLGAALIALTRLPLIFGGHFFPDGDECILGLMARHLAEGRECPVFFAGQRYGLSLVEAGFAAAAFRMFGMSAVVLKLAMLPLWALGWVFMVLSVRRWGGERAALIAGTALLFCPAWAEWSMKARGGYVTAFVMAHLCIWLIARMHGDALMRWTWGAAVGACLAVIAFAQPFWLTGVLPFLALLLYRRQRIRALGAVAGGAAPVAAVLILAGLQVQNRYWSPPVFAHPSLWLSLKELPYRFWVHLTGSYYLGQRREVGSFSELAANVWLASAVLLAVATVVQLRRRQFFSPGQAALLAVLGVLAVSLLINPGLFDYRYLLPSTGFLAMALGLEVPTWLRRPRVRKVLTVAGVLLILSGAAAFVEIGTVPGGAGVLSAAADHREREVVQALVDDLLAHGVHHVYSTDPLLQWTLMFASHEQIAARWLARTDRYPEYPRSVDRALFSGRPVALVGHIDEIPAAKALLTRVGRLDLAPHVIADTFFIVYDPGVPVIRVMQYQLSE